MQQNWMLHAFEHTNIEEIKQKMFQRNILQNISFATYIINKLCQLLLLPSILII